MAGGCLLERPDFGSHRSGVCVTDLRSSHPLHSDVCTPTGSLPTTSRCASSTKQIWNVPMWKLDGQSTHGCWNWGRIALTFANYALSTTPSVSSTFTDTETPCWRNQPWQRCAAGGGQTVSASEWVVSDVHRRARAAILLGVQSKENSAPARRWRVCRLPARQLEVDLLCNTTARNDSRALPPSCGLTRARQLAGDQRMRRFAVPPKGIVWLES
jgi:hypothetical protein